MIIEKKKLTPDYDPWEAYLDMDQYGKTNIIKYRIYNDLFMQYAL